MLSCIDSMTWIGLDIIALDNRFMPIEQTSFPYILRQMMWIVDTLHHLGGKRPGRIKPEDLVSIIYQYKYVCISAEQYTRLTLLEKHR